MDRALVDRQLVREGVNLSALARRLGVGRKALERHRNAHVSVFSARLHDEASTLSSSPLTVELVRRYDEALDALAAVQRAALSRNDAHHPSRAASNAAIVELVDAVGERVDSLTELFLDAAAEHHLQLPLDPEEAERMSDALARVLERARLLETA